MPRTTNACALSAFRSSDTRAIGAFASIVVVGRVVRIVSTIPRTFSPKARSAVPHTQFDIQVVDCLKGDVSGSVIVSQMGGYRPDGVLMLVNGRRTITPGATYLLAAKYSPPTGWYTLVTSGGAIRLPDPEDEDGRTHRATLISTWRDAAAH